MKTLNTYITEKLKISSNSDIKMNKDVIRYFKPASENDEYTNNVIKALRDKFSSKYGIAQGSTGSIYFYNMAKRGGRNVMRNLVCAIANSKSIDCNGDDKLEQTLGKEILDVINSVD